MTTLDGVCAFLERFAPVAFAESWDNVGLLVGDRTGQVELVMTCLTITPATVAEAIERGADLVVAHHPLPFHALKRITTDDLPGRLLWQLVSHRIAVYSPHTAFDSAWEGINQQLARGLRLQSIAPLIPFSPPAESGGAGRFGELHEPSSLSALATRLKTFLGLERVQAVGRLDRAVRRVGVACGAAGSFLAAAGQRGCDVLVLGETNLHTCLEAEATDVGLLLVGHFASERFAVERLAEVLAAEFPALTIWPAAHERNPLRWL